MLQGLDWCLCKHIYTITYPHFHPLFFITSDVQWFLSIGHALVPYLITQLLHHSSCTFVPLLFHPCTDPVHKGSLYRFISTLHCHLFFPVSPTFHPSIFPYPSLWCLCDNGQHCTAFTNKTPRLTDSLMVTAQHILQAHPSHHISMNCMCGCPQIYVHLSWPVESHHPLSPSPPL